MNKARSHRFLDSYTDYLKLKIQNRKWLGLSVIAFVLVVTGVVAQAQQPNRVPRIGYLSSDSPSTIAERIEAFRQGLRGAWVRGGEKHCH
jgi:hypothetical protein